MKTTQTVLDVAHMNCSRIGADRVLIGQSATVSLRLSLHDMVDITSRTRHALAHSIERCLDGMIYVSDVLNPTVEIILDSDGRNSSLRDDPFTSLYFPGTKHAITAHSHKVLVYPGQDWKQAAVDRMMDSIDASVIPTGVTIEDIILSTASATQASPFHSNITRVNLRKHGYDDQIAGSRIYFEAECENPDDARVQFALQEISNAMNLTVFATDSEFSHTNGTLYHITDDNTPISLTYSQKSVVLETDSSFECVAEYIAAYYSKLLRSVGITMLRVIEGSARSIEIPI